MKRRILAVFLVGLLLTSLVGCGKKAEAMENAEASGSKTENPAFAPEHEPDRQPSSPPKTEAQPESVPESAPENVPAGINPLTGLPMEPEYEKNRPIAVMFNNVKKALPQLGVSQADIIYEIPAEGGITRMVGVFQTMEGVGTLGSIRSTRPYFLEVALGHDALLVHAGASPDGYEKISAWGVNNMDGVKGGAQGDMFWRDPERRKNVAYEHSLMTSGENVLDYLERGYYRTEHKDGYTYRQAFAEDGTPGNGVAAKEIKLYFTKGKTSAFSYREDTGLYMVSEYEKAYQDGNTGEQVAVTNILVLETDIAEIPGDKEGRLTVRMNGSGKGTYICGGKAVEINWSKKDRNSQFVYALKDGTPLTMEKGVSYICITDADDSILEMK